MTFSEVIGQDNVKQRLLSMVGEGRVPHAHHAVWTNGLRHACPRIGSCLSTSGETEEGTNANVKAMLAKWQHPDLHFVFPVVKPKDASSGREVTSDDYARQWTEQMMHSPYVSFEEWLERMGAENQQAQIFAAEGDALTHKLSLKSSQGGYKVCVIWLPERMHTVFANKILKLLEEPPQQTVFIMASENPQLLLETIRSRVQRIDVKRIDDEAMTQALTQRRGLDADMAHSIARLSAGNWLMALEHLNMASERKLFHDMFVTMMRIAYQRNTKEMKRWAEAVATFGREKQLRMLRYFSSQVRENFMANFQIPELVFMTPEEQAFSKNFARFINEANVIDIMELIDHTIRAIGQNANAKMQFFDFALKIRFSYKK